MTQYWFAVLDDAIIPPKGLVDTFEAFNRMGSALYDGDWHGEEEAVVKDQEVDESFAPASEFGAGGIGEIRAARNEAIRRAEDILSEIRGLLISKDLIAVGVDETADLVTIKSDVWLGRYAPDAISDGKFFELAGRITSRKMGSSARNLVLMFDESALDKAILKRVSAKRSSFEEISKAAKLWLIERINRSPSKRPKNKKEFRDEYAKEYGPYIADTKWQSVWNAAIKETGAKAWSKRGSTKS